ncbi:hypothetical protein E2I00_004711, partial [Balaenoptera physalus]
QADGRKVLRSSIREFLRRPTRQSKLWEVVQPQPGKQAAGQPEVCKWNLQKLAEALEPALPLELAEAILAEEFDAEFRRHYLQKMRWKLGLVQAEREEDSALVARLLETMHLTAPEADGANCRDSDEGQGPASEQEPLGRLAPGVQVGPLPTPPAGTPGQRGGAALLTLGSGAERVRVMHANNPKYVLRNYIAQGAIEAAESGDFSEASGLPGPPL